jgi:hypothetical protein
LNEKVGNWIQNMIDITYELMNSLCINDKRVRDGESLIESVCEQGTREHEWTRKSGPDQTRICLTQAK